MSIVAWEMAVVALAHQLDGLRGQVARPAGTDLHRPVRPALRPVGGGRDE